MRVRHQLRDEPLGLGRVRDRPLQPLHDGGGDGQETRRARLHAARHVGDERFLADFLGNVVGLVVVLAVGGHGGVEVDQLRQALGHPLGHPGDDHPAEAVADQDDVAQVLVLQHVDDVGDEVVEVDGRAGEVDALAEAGAGRGVDVVAGRPQQRRDRVPDEGAGPLAGDQDERRRGSVLGGGRGDPAGRQARRRGRRRRDKRAAAAARHGGRGSSALRRP